MKKMRLIFSQDLYNDFQNVIDYVKLNSPQTAHSFAKKLWKRYVIKEISRDGKTNCRSTLLWDSYVNHWELFSTL